MLFNLTPQRFVTNEGLRHGLQAAQAQRRRGQRQRRAPQAAACRHVAAACRLRPETRVSTANALRQRVCTVLKAASLLSASDQLQHKLQRNSSFTLSLHGRLN
jgi:hypothetical protein